MWRNHASKRWYSVEVLAVAEGDAISKMQAHLTQRLGKSLEAVVVDHFFYRGEETSDSVRGDDGSEVRLWKSEPVSLKGVAGQPFHIEFGNRVLAPGAEA